MQRVFINHKNYYVFDIFGNLIGGGPASDAQNYIKKLEDRRVSHEIRHL